MNLIRMSLVPSVVTGALHAQITNTFPSTGNVEIGTTSPDKPLTVAGGTDVQGTVGYFADEHKLALTSGSGTISDSTVDGGIAIWRMSSQTSGTMWYGPYITLPAGNYIVQYRVKVASNVSSSAVITLDATNGAGVNSYGSIAVHPSDFRASGDWEMFSLPIAVSNGDNEIEFRGVNFNPGVTDFYLDYVNVIAGDMRGYSSPQLTVLPNGNVGIGTIAPVFGFTLTTETNGIFTRSSANNSGIYMTGQNGSFGLIQSVNYANTTPANLTLQQYGGNVGIGTIGPGYKLDVAGQIHTSGSIVYADGSTQSTAWTGSLCGGDYAESIDVSDGRRKYEPGDVLVIDPNVDGKFLKSSEPYSTGVAGVYSTKPGAIGRRQTTPKNADEIPMAVIGIVPVKVSAENGPIRRGDILVTSSIPGYAMKGTDRSRMFQAVVGKAMGTLESGTGVIEVLVSLQ